MSAAELFNFLGKTYRAKVAQVDVANAQTLTLLARAALAFEEKTSNVSQLYFSHSNTLTNINGFIQTHMRDHR